MTKIHIHHGIMTNGRKSTDILADRLIAEGYDINNPDFPGFATPRTANWFAKYYAKKLVKQIKKGDNAIGHSHGALVLLECMRRGAEFDTVIFLSAAVDRQIVFPYHGFKKLINVHNPKDIALLAGKYLPNSKMGAMGREGYLGPRDERVENLMRKSRVGKLNHTKPYFHGDGLAWSMDLCKEHL